ncbi:IS66 family insertion sequence element accessory protein TnpB [Pseudomonas sp. MWU12-2323]|nr:IS66 family insertion sequence element accessory protein TnpB [Pseudomonas sp. MWU12-2323]
MEFPAQKTSTDTALTWIVAVFGVVKRYCVYLFTKRLSSEATVLSV